MLIYSNKICSTTQDILISKKQVAQNVRLKIRNSQGKKWQGRNGKQKKAQNRKLRLYNKVEVGELGRLFEG